MNCFDSDGFEIAFIDEGAGAPVMLIHGFASNVVTNWVDPGWVRVLVRAGYRVIAFDNRGHGRSEKLYDEAVYGAELMAGDARRLLDHLGVETADVMGYSMGARITAFLAIEHPGRVRSAVFGGYGINMVRGVAARPVIAEGLEAASLDDVTDPTARAFRIFAQSTGSDLRALAVCFPRGRRIDPDRRSRDDCRARALRRRHGRRHRRLGLRVGRADACGRSARHPRPRPHEGGRRPGLQGWRRGVLGPSALAPIFALTYCAGIFTS